jgi:tripartite-type tricarboxylate transporter receptor subunit TctC
VIDKLYGAVKAALADPDLLKRYKVLSIDTDIIGMPPAEFASFFHTQLTKTVKGIRALGLKAN